MFFCSGLNLFSAPQSTTNLLLTKLKPQYQRTKKSTLSFVDYINQTLYISYHLHLNNNITYSYMYIDTANQTSRATYWDLGSMFCESPYTGICDKIIVGPDTGCLGPGCGVHSWQDTNLTCHHHSDFKYDTAAREQADYVWPESMYGKYYSTCNPNVTINSAVNCRFVLPIKIRKRVHHFNI